MRYFTGFFLSIALCMACADDASAHPRGPSAAYIVTAEDESGRELRTFHHGGQTFVLGSYGERYNIRVRNRTARRVEAVVTVDGRDVITGEVGDFVDGRGYIIGPYDEVLIEGFRQSLDAVAAFRFSNPEDSYSARMGTPQHVGIIGVAIFPERAHRPIARPRPRKHSPRTSPLRRGYDYEEDALGGSGRGASPSAEADAAPTPQSSPRARKGESSAGADRLMSPYAAEGSATRADGYAERRQRPQQNLGTEYGETRHSAVREVTFRRADRRHPASIITLRYDDRDGLLARGIRIHPPYPRVSRREPDPFPNSRFAPPPPRW